MMSLDRKIDLFGTAEPREEEVRHAQHQLEAAIEVRAAGAPRRVTRRTGWLAAAAASAAAVVAMLWMPLAPTTALAFEQVQEHFRNFQTMVFEMQQTMNGEPLMKARVSVLHDGSVRTEVGDDITVVVNMREQRVLTLSESSRMAVVTPFEGATGQDDALGWIDEIRQFQGAAEKLRGTRTIRGIETVGWKLDVAGSTLTLWTDARGLPIEMQLDQGMQINTSFEFEFNRPLSPALFSTEIPAGYSRDTED